MTEADWLACSDLQPMLDWVRGSASERKMRLFAVACCRRISHLLNDERSRQALEVAQRYADGLGTDDGLEEARESASDATGATHRSATAAGWSRITWIANAAANAAHSVCGHWENWLSDTRLFETPGWSARALAGPEVEGVLSDLPHREDFEAEQAIQCQLLRDLFGLLPFREPKLNGAILQWQEAAVIKLAQGIYEDHAFDHLSVLADAIEEAGCADAAFIDHLRSTGPHVRGCWVVDLILGKG
jgi:hypothetical protein